MRLILRLAWSALIAAIPAATWPSNGATVVAMSVLPPALAEYKTWRQLTPAGYSIPPQLALLCTAPAPAPSQQSIETFGPHANTYVRVFGNSLAVRALTSRDRFPEGSIVVKEKLPDPRSDVSSAQGVMIKRQKGFDPSTGDWEFHFYPSERSASFANCSNCHRSAQHDFVFGSYPTK